MRTIGSTSIEVFEICLGGKVFGWTADAAESNGVLDAYAEAGGNFIDTADVYSAWVPGHTGGESEVIIGDWMTARGNRAHVVVGTKLGRHPEFKGLAPDTVRAAADASLARLSTDYIDIYY